MKLFAYRARMFEDYGIRTKVIIASNQDVADRILKEQVKAERNLDAVIVADRETARDLDLDPVYHTVGQVWFVDRQEEITEGTTFTTFYLE